MSSTSHFRFSCVATFKKTTKTKFLTQIDFFNHFFTFDVMSELLNPYAPPACGHLAANSQQDFEGKGGYVYIFNAKFKWAILKITAKMT